MNFKCPFHNDKNASFSIKNNFFICYGCKKKGVNNNIFIVKKFELYFDKKIIKYAKYNLFLNKNFWLKYLLIREINMITALNFNLGCLNFKLKNKNINNILLNRLIFPILNEKNILESIGVKNLNYKNKYLFFSKNNNLNLYGINYINNFNYVIVVEGYFDLLTLKKNFIKNSVSILGSNINCNIIIKLLNKFNKIYFCFDGDFAGYNADYIIKTKYKKFKNRIFSTTLPYNYDPDNYIKKFGIISFLKYLKI
ncbi:putative DNA primase [Candidatus Carsonella ruddii HT isolate Thao2000]|uniref:Putative DNA primase n=1 Tax=Candidatus Carsonella ruddii HT isolate Thao2000 TaxID=1202539 RepID=J3Z1G3_CARRU|nr:toprim domain-containing protein [Candidatus Carsonella ruddii]AFP84104.1 putative DNA primase [Candidatus Carsonella ruddii HT isolate Thao2000]